MRTKQTVCENGVRTEYYDSWYDPFIECLQLFLMGVFFTIWGLITIPFALFQGIVYPRKFGEELHNSQNFD